MLGTELCLLLRVHELKIITAINDGDERKNLCEAISKDIYDLFIAAQEQDLLYKFDFLEGVAEYRYQHMIPLIVYVCY